MVMLRENRKMRPIEGDSIEASFSGGLSRSSDETSVMEVERRTWAIRFNRVNNPKGED